jgi:hypothetical protein
MGQTQVLAVLKRIEPATTKQVRIALKRHFGGHIARSNTSSVVTNLARNTNLVRVHGDGYDYRAYDRYELTEAGDRLIGDLIVALVRAADLTDI